MVDSGVLFVSPTGLDGPLVGLGRPRRRSRSIGYLTGRPAQLPPSSVTLTGFAERARLKRDAPTVRRSRGATMCKIKCALLNRLTATVSIE
jgi:hypothetical protein